MSESDSSIRMQHTPTSAHITLGAGLIASTLFLVAASIVAVGCLIASTQSMGTIPEGADDKIRVMFFGFLSLANVIVFNIFGIVGLIKTMRAYKELERRSRGM